MYNNNPSRLLIQLQIRYLIFCLFLMVTSIGSFGYASAGAASAPLGITATVVHSCKLSTVSLSVDPEASPSINTKIVTKFSPVIDVACPHALSLRIAVSFKNQNTGVALTGPTINAAYKVSREVLTEPSLNQLVTQPPNGRVMIAPEARRAAKVISSPDKNAGGQGDSLRNYADYVIVAVNF